MVRHRTLTAVLLAFLTFGGGTDAWRRRRRRGPSCYARNGGWSGWGSWNKACGNRRTRGRSCSSPSAYCGGRSCSGSSSSQADTCCPRSETYVVPQADGCCAGLSKVDEFRKIMEGEAGVCLDVTAPVITLSGGNATLQHETTQTAGHNYVDPGTKGSDTYDGDITSRIQYDPPDMRVVGTHVITYTLTDAAGNVADSVNRTCIIVDTLGLFLRCNAGHRYGFKTTGGSNGVGTELGDDDMLYDEDGSGSGNLVSGRDVYGSGQYTPSDTENDKRICEVCPANTYQSRDSHQESNCTTQLTCAEGQLYVDSKTKWAQCKPCPAHAHQPSKSHRETDCILQKTQPSSTSTPDVLGTRGTRPDAPEVEEVINESNITASVAAVISGGIVLLVVAVVVLNQRKESIAGNHVPARAAGAATVLSVQNRAFGIDRNRQVTYGEVESQAALHAGSNVEQAYGGVQPAGGASGVAGGIDYATIDDVLGEGDPEYLEPDSNQSVVYDEAGRVVQHTYASVANGGGCDIDGYNSDDAEA